MDLRFYPIIDAQFARGEKAVELTNAFIRGGAKIIQYRNKRDRDEVFEEEARRIMEEIRISNIKIQNKFEIRISKFKINSKFEYQNSKQVLFIVNDRIEIAKRMGADGVHLGKEDLGQIRNSNIESRSAGQNKSKILNSKFQKKQGIIDMIRDYLGKGKIIGITARNSEEAIWAEKEGADYIGLSAVFATNTKKDALAMGLEGLRRIVKKVKIPTVAIGGINEKNISEVLKTGVRGVAVVSAICCAKNPEEAVRRFMFKAGANGGLPVQRRF